MFWKVQEKPKRNEVGMALKARVDKLEKEHREQHKLIAFIGIPEEIEDHPFDVAGKYWKENKSKQPNYIAASSGFPWRHYQGKQVRFLGYGTKDDLWVSMGGDFDKNSASFLFLKDIEDLLKEHWHDFLKVRSKLVKDGKVCHEIIESLPEGMQKLIHLFTEKYTFRED